VTMRKSVRWIRAAVSALSSLSLIYSRTRAFKATHKANGKTLDQKGQNDVNNSRLAKRYCA